MNNFSECLANRPRGQQGEQEELRSVVEGEGKRESPHQLRRKRCSRVKGEMGRQPENHSLESIPNLNDLVVLPSASFLTIAQAVSAGGRIKRAAGQNADGMLQCSNILQNRICLARFGPQMRRHQRTSGRSGRVFSL